ncbi:hypothetical protein B0H19DRAFT_1081142 [Mycena capillaripes]|nr:hypothetical protein B0H19DRAFT_1086288 [Mycena capillaripes]KAJ6533733.1 hypothetical protein B0H19DRAFT_1081142 [Mycena capillaripes]
MLAAPHVVFSIRLPSHRCESPQRDYCRPYNPVDDWIQREKELQGDIKWFTRRIELYQQIMEADASREDSETSAFNTATDRIRLVLFRVLLSSILVQSNLEWQFAICVVCPRKKKMCRNLVCKRTLIVACYGMHNSTLIFYLQELPNSMPSSVFEDFRNCVDSNQSQEREVSKAVV